MVTTWVRSVPTIVISYRRDDSKAIAGRIFDRLEGHYGSGRVFMDIDSIPFGLDFREHIRDTLQRCDILVAVIGRNWLDVDEDGRSRIADETDWVRIEIGAALAKNIPVIPVLVDGIRMPKSSDLPDSMRSFVFRQAAEVDSGRDFRMHMERLIRSMDELLDRQRPPATPQPSVRDPVSPTTREAVSRERTRPEEIPRKAGGEATSCRRPGARRGTDRRAAILFRNSCDAMEASSLRSCWNCPADALDHA